MPVITITAYVFTCPQCPTVRVYNEKSDAFHEGLRHLVQHKNENNEPKEDKCEDTSPSATEQPATDSLIRELLLPREEGQPSPNTL